MWRAWRAAQRPHAAARAFSTFTDGMSAAQMRVVRARGRPTLVVGGAGTGKSVTLAARLSGVVQRGEAASEHVVGVAMSEASQRRLQHHVDMCTPLRYGNVHVCTVHAWALEMVQAHALQLQLPAVRVLHPWREAALLTDNLMRLPLKRLRPVGERTRYVRGMLSAFGRLQRAGVTADELRAAAASDSGRDATVWAELADAWDAFTDLKLQRGLLSFDDQITQSLRLLRENSAAARDIRAQFTHVVCDDAQDLTPAQFELVALASTPSSIAFACDEDARVYPSALPSALSALRTHYGEELDVTALHDGYRCAATVHEAARRLVCVNKGRAEVEAGVPMHVHAVSAPPPLFAHPIGNTQHHAQQQQHHHQQQQHQEDHPEIEGVSSVWEGAEFEAGVDEAVRVEHDAVGVGEAATEANVSHVSFADQWEEEDGVARMVAERWEHDGVQPGDVAVLTRTADDAERMARALDRHGVPTAGVSGSGVLQAPEVARLVSFLHMAADPADTAQLYNWLTSPPVSLQPREITFLMRVRNRHKLTLRGAMARVARGDANESYPRELRDVCTRVSREVDMWERMATRLSAKELVFRYLKHYALLDRYYSPANARAERESQGIARFLQLLKKLSDDPTTAATPTTAAVKDAPSAHVGTPAALLLPRLTAAAAAAHELPAEHCDTPNQVRVMPLLKAAHIECGHVYIVRASDAALPGRRWSPLLALPAALVPPSTRDAHVEAMRRLVYVAMTRTGGGSVTFTHAASYGGKRLHRPSRFIAEAMITPGPEPVAPPPSFEDADAAAAAAVAEDTPPAPTTRSQTEEFTVPLSYTRIKAYTTCPAMYQFQYVMKLPHALPAKVAMGRALHHAVDVHGRSLLPPSDAGGEPRDARAPARSYAPHCEADSVRVGEEAPLRVSVAEGAGEEAVLQEALRRTWRWGSNGFLSAEDERDSYEYCKEVLSGYFARHKESGRTVCAVEMPFRIVSDDGLFRLVGRIDRLERTPDGELVVVEFKTRLPRTIKTLTTKTGRRRKGAVPDLQLLLYTYAFHSVYGHLPARCVRVALDDGREDAFVPDAGDVAAAKRMVVATAEGVRANRFAATPSFKACRKCAYGNVCKDKFQRRK